MHGKSKLKKAFCEPGNILFCPPISVATALCFGHPVSSNDGLIIHRSAENGGDVIFKTRDELEAAFVQGDQVLHPGDLKGAVIPIVVSTLEKLANEFKADGEIMKAGKTLKVLAKKLAKNKNKK